MALIVRPNQPSFRDQRANLGIPEDQIIPFTYELGFHPSFAPMKKYWDEGKLVVLLGIGYPNPSLSHFRSMDIWATCEPDTMGRAPEGEWMWCKESTYIHLAICWEGARAGTRMLCPPTECPTWTLL